MNVLNKDLLIKITSYLNIKNKYYLTNKILYNTHKFYSDKFKLKEKYFKGIKNYWYNYASTSINVNICKLRESCKTDLHNIKNELNKNFLDIDYISLKILTNQYVISRERYESSVQIKKHNNRSRVLRRLNNIGMTDSDEVDIENLTGWGYNY